MILILCKLAAGSLAVFLSILVWSKTRDIAWLFVILGVIVAYGEIVFQVLKIFGIAAEGAPFFEILLAVLPSLFLAAAFLALVMRRRQM